MYSLCEKNFFDTLAEVLGDALLDLIAGNTFATLIHKKRRSTDSKRISNGFASISPRSARSLWPIVLLSIRGGHLLSVHLLYSKWRKKSIRRVHKMCIK